MLSFGETLLRQMEEKAEGAKDISEKSETMAKLKFDAHTDPPQAPFVSDAINKSSNRFTISSLLLC